MLEVAFVYFDGFMEVYEINEKFLVVIEIRILIMISITKQIQDN